jgi:DNA adenine methylase
VFKQRKTADLFDLGFATFYLNRCNRSGILTGGVIGGLEQTGEWKMDARFARNALITRVEAIADRRTSIKIRNWDAERFLIDYAGRLESPLLVYCDPPFFHKADRLYPNYYRPADHERIAKVIQSKLKRPWLVSYDDCPEILSHYSARKWFRHSLQYNANTAYRGVELFIASDEVQWPKDSSIPSVNAAMAEMP